MSDQIRFLLKGLAVTVSATVCMLSGAAAQSVDWQKYAFFICNLPLSFNPHPRVSGRPNVLRWLVRSNTFQFAPACERAT